VVTEYDRKVQQLLMSLLREAVPEAHFFCEEMDERDRLDAEHLFIIDPIDGTMNFVHGFGQSCISVAYCSRGELLAGSVYNPYRDELFTAIRGGGAFCNGRAIHVSEAPFSETVTVCGSSPYNPELTEKTFALMRMAYLESLDIRRQGSAALDLCSAASGRAGVYFEMQISLWDYAAGKLLVEEAGGVCCDIHGGELPFDGRRPSARAGSRENVETFLRLSRGLV
jgi:myo-inositol-1(or 4)-monophosphatase